MLKVASGQTAILGGLMLDSFDGKRDGLPVASRIPVFGDLVSFRNDTVNKTELVIFIRPMVIRDASVEGDLASYRRFLPDPQFFRDTHAPVPCFEAGLQRLEDRALKGEYPCTVPQPVVPPPTVEGQS
jgi:general secretion pathway protein D